MKFDAKTIHKVRLPEGKTDFTAFHKDIPGFGLRVRKSGLRTWIFQYKRGSKHRRMKLGRASVVEYGEAQKKAAELHAQVSLGGDPANDKAVNNSRANNSLGDVITRYLEIKREELRPRSFAEVERHLEQNVGTLRAVPITAVDRLAIADVLSRIAKENGPIAANRTRASLSAMFGWAVREGVVEINPAFATNKREETSRDRVLSDDELRSIWHNCKDDHYGAIVRLLMLTGQRANEMGSLQWPEIDFRTRQISLPGDRVKNGRDHIVPMSDAVIAILEKQERSEERPFVFGYGEGPFSGWSKSKERLDQRIGKTAALKHWTIHDLRRTVSTGMNEIGILPHIVEAVINHASGHKGGVAGVYNKAKYLPEKRQALDVWASHVTALAKKEISNITPLKRA